MGIGEIAGLIAAIAFAVLAGFMIYPLIKLGKLFEQIGTTVKDTGDHAVPALDEGVTTVKQLNKTLSDVNAISESASYTAQNVGALTDLYGSMLGKPIIKIASTFWALKQTFTSFMGKKKKATPASSDAKDSDAAADAFVAANVAADARAAASHSAHTTAHTSAHTSAYTTAHTAAKE
jgi:uncharacterized protein YoxC